MSCTQLAAMHNLQERQIDRHGIFQKGTWIEHSKKRFKVHTQMILLISE